MKIKVINPIFCEVIGSKDLIAPAISYQKEYYVQGQFAKKRKTFKKSPLFKGDKITSTYMHTGLLNRVIDYCTKFKIPFSIIGDPNVWYDNYFLPPRLNGIELRDYQKEAIYDARDFRRGVIQGMPGSGKTVIMAGIYSTFSPDTNALFICQTNDLFYQTYARMKEYFPKIGVGRVGDSHFEIDEPVTIGMIQSLKNMIDYPFLSKYQLVNVDECHHISSFDGIYVSVLERVPAPYRFGFTATINPSAEAQLACEALLGGGHHKISTERLRELGVLAEPKLELHKLPKSETIRKAKNYKAVYQLGVVGNRIRNRRIITRAWEAARQGETTLILVSQKEHGRNLESAAALHHPDLKVRYIEGSTDTKTRLAVKKALTEKSLDCAITTTIWKEGVDLPSLNVVINAVGGKSEVACLQVLGRGLRTTADKTQVTFVDFFDPSHHYLVSHFGERLSLYFELGWL